MAAELLIKVREEPYYRKSTMDVFIRILIILCTTISVVLSSISVCDGHWLLVDGKVIGLWYFCTLKENHKSEYTTDFCAAEVDGLYIGFIFIRIMVTFAVVLAMFGLEMLVVSQVYQDVYSTRRWAFGSFLVVLAFFMTSAGVLSFVIHLRNFLTFTGFSLTFWCEFIATFLFFLNGMSGLHIHSMTFSVNTKFTQFA
ncbi:voltage-dependent calcium channel gamma-like subunit [Callorhinchus milii]|uniref:Transmembrane protein 37 n=1 Tax=Callorhinchus milii TaxID=7868 RepID=K4G0D9_CALMI|nr:voltage-dependent calcium channel gamma-like subunit [Callorhinchus milii]AFK11096.1 voltage-dependent calcium channel gamma-like subunit-like protein [Callorhinchus milii]|eukprot:gi/632957199/ref/XP_007894351.1/ PREDICTED: voltage-dependent calcium channel gamma-like subunit [Callorhinchus milii]